MELAKYIFSGIVVEGNANHLAMKFSMKAAVAPHIPRKACKCSQKDVIFFRDVLMINVTHSSHSSFDFQLFSPSTFSPFLRIVRDRNIIFIDMRQLVARDSTEDIILLKIDMAQLCNSYLALCDSCLPHSY